MVIARSRDSQRMAFISCLGRCCLLVHPGEMKRRQWEIGNSAFAIKGKARNLCFHKHKTKRKSKLALLFQEAQKKTLKEADYSLSRFPDMCPSLPAYICHPSYKSCGWDERARLTPPHCRV